MSDEPSTLEFDRRAAEATQAFGFAVRARRRELGMTQGDLALSTGVSRRYVIELEAGKATAQLGRALVIAKCLGIEVGPFVAADPSDALAMPDFEDDDVVPPHIL